MATETALPITVTMASLPVGFKGTPQQIADAIAERLTLTTQQVFALFFVGATEPSYDVGPWAKNGNSWYYWDSDTGDYQPFVIPQGSLGYQMSLSEPTDDAIVVWFEIDADGLPVSIKTRSNQGGAVTWTSVYYLKTEVYTQAETQLQITLQKRWIAKAKPNLDQTVAIDAADHKLTMNAELLDPDGAYTEADAKYICPVKGIYEAVGTLFIDNDTGTASGMQIVVDVWSNGVTSGTKNGSGGSNVASPNGSQWIVNFNVPFQANAGDFVELSLNATDGVNTGNLTLLATGSFWSVRLVQALAS